MTKSEMNEARAALAKLTDEERVLVFRELGLCACATLSRKATQNPEMAVGAALGAVLGAVFKAAVKSETKKQIEAKKQIKAKELIEALK